jgi:GT2 family glycosyltransferase
MARTLSVLIPIYNEERALTALLDAVEERPEVSEIVIVDDGSTDGTADILAARTFTRPTQVIRHPRNAGKGSAIRTAIAAAGSELALIQDADLEYDPADYPALLAPFERHGVTVVFGSRSFSSHSAYSFWFVMGNKLVTLWTNLLFNSYISETYTEEELNAAKEEYSSTPAVPMCGAVAACVAAVAFAVYAAAAVHNAAVITAAAAVLVSVYAWCGAWTGCGRSGQATGNDRVKQEKFLANATRVGQTLPA